MTENVLPEAASGSTLLRVQATSKLAFGATTAALVTLASGGTAVLVSHGTGSMARPTSLPAGATLPDVGSGAGAVVVGRAAGAPPAAPSVAQDPTVQALKDALAQRPEPGPRTLVVPLLQLVPPASVVGPDVPPVLEPPVQAPPRGRPPVVVPPVAGPPAVRGGSGEHEHAKREERSEDEAEEQAAKAARGAAHAAAKATRQAAHQAGKQARRGAVVSAAATVRHGKHGSPVKGSAPRGRHAR